MHAAGVRYIFLTHGTFVGEDLLGVLRAVRRIWPKAGEYLQGLQRSLVDAVMQDNGNFSRGLLTWFQQCAAEAASDLHVESLDWSGENDHVGRADGAIGVLDRLAALQLDPGRRVLLWAHSHGGSVLALTTNLLAADRAGRQAFFDAARAHYRNPITGGVDLPAWERVQQALDRDDQALRRLTLDMMTFGAPIRYGWDTSAVDRLAHVVFHRPRPGLPEYRAGFPPHVADILLAAGGDYVQQLGVAGTNFPPALIDWRKWLAEIQLEALLQKGVRNRDVLKHMRCGARVHQDGLSLLIDYGDVAGNLTEHLAGHAVYTRETWLPYHARLAVEHFYADAVGPHS